MTRPPLFSPAAQADLSGIWEFTAGRWGAEQADRYVLAIRDACDALASGRRRGRAVDAIRPGYLRLAVRSHLVFYRTAEDGRVVVVRVLHQRMDATARLRE